MVCFRTPDENGNVDLDGITAIPALGFHERPHVLGQQEGGSQHNLQHVFPFFLRKLLQRGDVLQSGIVNEDVDSFVLLERGIDDVTTRSSLRQVGANKMSSDIFGNRATFRLIHVDNNNIVAFST